uniref:Exocyst complex component Sec10 n=1 Tax=Lutzomyia longipalpis TaxID=7200 RepID=A0A1B0CI49_LUTLO
MEAECHVLAKKITEEANQLRSLFDETGFGAKGADSPIKIISTLGNLLTCDFEMLVLDLHTLFASYPSISEDQLMRLFYIRNDIKANEVKEKIQDAIRSRKSTVSHDKQDSIFKEIVFSDRLW